MKRFIALVFALFASFAFGADPQNPFTPRSNGCVTISATTASAATALVAPGAQNVIVYNAGSGRAFVEFCTSSTCTAVVASSYPVDAAQKEALGLPANATHVATITSSGTATIYACVGVGS
jgi:hypothetical protein